ncbi:MAG: CotH kinase family protein [Bacteroidales bacterium]|nr:CotH kinase family protein [Bacteroidales bacterium]
MKRTLTLLSASLALFMGSVVESSAAVPQSKDQTDAIIAAKGQLTSAPTIYIWMLDAEVEYDENNQPVKPMEYKNTTGDKNDNYYMIKMNGGSSYDTPISNNIIATNSSITDNAALRPNYTTSEPKTDEYRLARIKVVDGTPNGQGLKERDELTTIRGRGNSTWSSPKKSYRLKFPNKTKFLSKADGTNEYADAKNWTLLANVADKTMLRNALTAEVARRYEIKTGIKAMPYYPAYKYVDLVLNGEYIGTYQISDHTQIQTGRIEIDEDNGWFLEGVSTETKFIEDPHINFDGLENTQFTLNVKNPEDKYYTTEVQNSIKEYITNILNCRNAPYDFSETTGLFKYVDMESAVAYFIANEITGNFDGLISNYAYRDINPDDKLKLGPLWDFDIAYGNFVNFGANELVNHFIFERGKATYNPLPQLSKALVENSPEFVNLLVERWDKIFYDASGGKGLTNNMTYHLNRIAGEMQETRVLNYTPKENGGAGWDTNIDYLYWVAGSTYATYDLALSALQSFINSHNDWLNEAIHALKDNMTLNTTYILDAESQPSGNDPLYFIPEDYHNKICNVKLDNRTFAAGEWNTICLPFSLDYDQLKATFGNDVQLLEYSSIVGDFMKFTPAPDTRLVAGVPYLMKFSGNNVVNPTFNQVGISCMSPATISYSDNPAYSFTGTYFKTNIATDGTTMLLDAGDEAFEENTSASTLTGLSAYITRPTNGETSMPIYSNWMVFQDEDLNTSIIEEYIDKTVSILIKGRTLYRDGSWNSLCLPFAVNNATGTIFEGATFMRMGSAEFENQTLKLNFSIQTGNVTIPAGEPFFVKWGDSDNNPGDVIEEPRFKDVVIAQTSPITLFGNPDGALDAEEGSVVALTGIYDPLKIKKTGDNTILYLAGGNNLYYPNGKMTIGAFRAYFQLLGELTAGDPTSPSGVRAFELNFENEETGISTITKEERIIEETDAWYTLDGRRLSSEPTTSGIYINRGRKVVIK